MAEVSIPLLLSVSAYVGGVQCEFPVKILLPSGFPSIPPKVYIQPDSQSKLVSTSYLQGAEVSLPAILKWNFNPNPQYRQYNTSLVSYSSITHSIISCIIYPSNLEQNPLSLAIQPLAILECKCTFLKTRYTPS